MSNTQYPLHSQYLRLIDAEQAILNDLKNKSTPLIINDAYVPPINYERTDLPWALGSKAQPWRNLYISNKGAEDLTPERTEVIDVYAALVNAVTQADLNALRTEIASTYTTKTYVDNLVDVQTQRIATTEKAGAIKLHQQREYWKFVSTNDATRYTYIKATISGNLKLIDGTETEISYWERSDVELYDSTLHIYTGPLAMKKVGEAFPNKYKEEFNDYYTVVDGTVGSYIECKKHPTEVIKTPYENSVYLDEYNRALINVQKSATDKLGVVRVDGTTITINEDGVISSAGTGSGNVKAVLGEE